MSDSDSGNVSDEEVSFVVTKVTPMPPNKTGMPVTKGCKPSQALRGGGRRNNSKLIQENREVDSYNEPETDTQTPSPVLLPRGLCSPYLNPFAWGKPDAYIDLTIQIYDTRKKIKEALESDL